MERKQMKSHKGKSLTAIMQILGKANKMKSEAISGRHANAQASQHYVANFFPLFIQARAAELKQWKMNFGLIYGKECK